MSKKATHVQAASQPQAQATAPADSAVAIDTTAVVRASTAESPEPIQPVKTPRDEHHGQGGHYEIRDGQRVLVQRTEPQA